MALPIIIAGAVVVIKILAREALANAGKSAAESVVDNIFRDAVTPIRGSMLYCDMAFGNMGHSGIYVGHDLIVEFCRDGDVRYSSPREFIEGTTAVSIYVSCIDESAVGDERAAERAEALVGSTRNYSLLTNNCHMFCSECLTGRENSDKYLWKLKNTAEQIMGVNTWRVWDIDSEDLF